MTQILSQTRMLPMSVCDLLEIIDFKSWFPGATEHILSYEYASICWAAALCKKCVVLTGVRFLEPKK